MGTATFSEAGTLVKNFLLRRQPNHDLLCTEESDQAAIGAPKAQEKFKTLLSRYFRNKSEKVPEALSGFYTSGFYTRDSCSMRAVSFMASFGPAFSVCSYISVVADVKCGAGEVVQVSAQDHNAQKEIAACDFDPAELQTRESSAHLLQC